MAEQLIEADVIVAGGGNAALCAALVARESGVSVAVLECAPFEYRGGNSRHTRNMRCMHERPTDVLTDTVDFGPIIEPRIREVAALVENETQRAVSPAQL